MAIKNASILSGATAAFTAGTAKTFLDDGVTVPNGVHIVANGTVDASVREHATIKYRPPVLDARGTLGKTTYDISYTVPLKDAVTSVIENTTVRIGVSQSRLMSAAAQLELRKQVAQFLLDSDFDNYWSVGSCS